MRMRSELTPEARALVASMCRKQGWSCNEQSTDEVLLSYYADGYCDDTGADCSDPREKKTIMTYLVSLLNDAGDFEDADFPVYLPPKTRQKAVLACKSFGWDCGATSTNEHILAKYVDKYCRDQPEDPDCATKDQEGIKTMILSFMVESEGECSFMAIYDGWKKYLSDLDRTSYNTIVAETEAATFLLSVANHLCSTLVRSDGCLGDVISTTLVDIKDDCGKFVSKSVAIEISDLVEGEDDFSFEMCEDEEDGTCSSDYDTYESGRSRLRDHRGIMLEDGDYTITFGVYRLLAFIGVFAFAGVWLRRRSNRRRRAAIEADAMQRSEEIVRELLSKEDGAKNTSKHRTKKKSKGKSQKKQRQKNNKPMNSNQQVDAQRGSGRTRRNACNDAPNSEREARQHSLSCHQETLASSPEKQRSDDDRGEQEAAIVSQGDSNTSEDDGAALASSPGKQRSDDDRGEQEAAIASQGDSNTSEDDGAALPLESDAELSVFHSDSSEPKKQDSDKESDKHFCESTQNLLEFLERNSSCMKGSPREFLGWLCKNQDICSIDDLAEAISDDDFIEEAIKAGGGAIGIKKFKRITFRKAVLLASTLDTEDAKIPTELICPISHVLMTDDPVITADGHTYERAAITAWIDTQKAKIERARNQLRSNPDNKAAKNIIESGILSPMSGMTLENTTLMPNHVIKRIALDIEKVVI